MLRCFLSVLFFITFSQNLFSQAVFAWCPEEQIIFPKNGFLEGKIIDLYIYDARISTENALVTCSGEMISKNLIRLIEETYTSADINIIKSRVSAVEASSNRVKIEIGIARYQVEMDTGMNHEKGGHEKNSIPKENMEESWKAVVGYSLKIIDLSKGEKSGLTNFISESTISSKVEDHGVARDLLSNAFDKANRELMTLIDDAFIYKYSN